jgi:hypothetical protein
MTQVVTQRLDGERRAVQLVGRHAIERRDHVGRAQGIAEAKVSPRWEREKDATPRSVREQG